MPVNIQVSLNLYWLWKRGNCTTAVVAQHYSLLPANNSSLPNKVPCTDTIRLNQCLPCAVSFHRLLYHSMCGNAMQWNCSTAPLKPHELNVYDCHMHIPPATDYFVFGKPMAQKKKKSCCCPQACSVSCTIKSACELRSTALCCCKKAMHS